MPEQVTEGQSGAKEGIPSRAAPPPNLNTNAPGSDKDALREGLRAEREPLQNVVGLFGTCGNSTWREPVMKRFDAAGIKYFNPVVKDWNPSCAAIEAQNLATDRALLFVVTNETEAVGSLAETGWAAFSANRNGQNLGFVIEDYKDPEKGLDPKHQANRARKLVRAHAEKAGVKIFPSIDSAVDATIEEMKRYSN